MNVNLLAKLGKTTSVDLSDEMVRTGERSLSEAELGSVAGGAAELAARSTQTAAKAQHIVFNVGSTITVTNSNSGGVMDDCED
jgi:hypothetical protein